MFIAWHEFEGGKLIQTDFVIMDFQFISCFISDFSENSAKKYINGFEV